MLVCLPVLFGASNSLSYVFTAGVPNYRCFIPECEDPHDTSFTVPWMDWAIPHEASDNQVIGVKADTCLRYAPRNISELNTTACSKYSFTETVEKCSEWIFDENERTIVNDWNITCLENQWKIALVGSSHFAGIVVGSFVFGVLADRFGRKLIFILCIFIMSVSGALQVLSPNYVTFIVFMFLNSLGTAGVYPFGIRAGTRLQLHLMLFREANQLHQHKNIMEYLEALLLAEFKERCQDLDNWDQNEEKNIVIWIFAMA
ncbi:hypothetical protein JTB14_014675 [Gonioctena quinquepunctata]|nr:hypothetical protein JTB14_014675 [Gonioctena quinquepunctata]